MKTTSLMVSYTANTLENAEAFFTLLVDTIEPIHFNKNIKEQQYQSVIEGEEPSSYFDCTAEISIGVHDLSDVMDIIPMLLKNGCDRFNKAVPDVNDDWYVAVLMSAKPNADEIQESVYHLYRKSQEYDSVTSALEKQNELLHSQVVMLKQRMSEMEEKYKGLMAFLHHGVNIKSLMNVVVETANQVDEDILSRNQYHSFLYQ